MKSGKDIIFQQGVSKSKYVWLTFSKNAYKQLWIFHVRLYFFFPGVLGLASQSVPESIGFITFSHCDWLPHRLQVTERNALLMMLMKKIKSRKNNNISPRKHEHLSFQAVCQEDRGLLMMQDFQPK